MSYIVDPDDQIMFHLSAIIDAGYDVEDASLIFNSLAASLLRERDLRAELARLTDIRFNSGSFGPYIFGMDVADGMETTVVSRIEEDGTITVIDECRRSEKVK